MTVWQPTPALIGAVVAAVVGTGIGLLFGRPDLVLLVSPLALLAALGLRHRPQADTAASSELGSTRLEEGASTWWHLDVSREHVEQVTRQVVTPREVAVEPRSGSVVTLLRRGDEADLVLSPRRWGVHELGSQLVAVTSPWGGFSAWRRDAVNGWIVSVPAPRRFDSRAAVPQPQGLVGAHRSARPGDGTEFAGIREFTPGDRLRRINWRVSLRTGDLHVVSTLAEQDAGVLLAVDANADHGSSDGVDGPASSLDLGVRAACAIAEHHVRTGDRVALRVMGIGAESVGFGSGRRHLRRLQEVLTGVRVGAPRGRGEQFRFHCPPGTFVFVLSPMLDERVAAATVSLTRRRLPVVVIDTLPADLTPAAPPGTHPEVARVAWRIRLAERELLLGRLSRVGCPVLRWDGTGSVDEIMRRLGRRSRFPQAAR